MNLIERVYERTIGGRVFGRRVHVLCDHLAPLIPPNSRVLDVGCGNGLIASNLKQRRPDLEVQGIDVLIQEQSFIPVERFDGQTIPYPDDTFDVVMFIDVLHHCNNQMDLLREAVRVARKAVLIKDHPKDGWLAGPNLRFMDWVANRRHGIALPYNYWPKQRWDEAFKDLGVTVSFWETKLGLYKPAGLLFGRGLHFIARLDIPSERRSVAARNEKPASTISG
jgi:SAM-dependent methyltransferase